MKWSYFLTLVIILKTKFSTTWSFFVFVADVMDHSHGLQGAEIVSKVIVNVQIICWLFLS